MAQHTYIIRIQTIPSISVHEVLDPVHYGLLQRVHFRRQFQTFVPDLTQIKSPDHWFQEQRHREAPPGCRVRCRCGAQICPPLGLGHILLLRLRKQPTAPPDWPFPGCRVGCGPPDSIKADGTRSPHTFSQTSSVQIYPSQLVSLVEFPCKMVKQPQSFGFIGMCRLVVAGANSCRTGKHGIPHVCPCANKDP